MKYIDPDGKLLHHIDRIADIRVGETPPPVNVEIMLSNACQLHCKNCHFAHTHNGEKIDSGLMETILAELYVYGTRSITWTGGGEPLLHPKALTFFDTAKMPQGIYTNGLHITPEAASVLRNKMTFVYVSLDSANAQAYLRDKQADKFERVCANVRLLAEQPGKATIGIGCLIDGTNIADAPEMIHIAKDMGANYIQFRPRIVFDIADKGHRAENTEWTMEAVRQLSAFNDDPFVICDVGRFAEYGQWEGHGYNMCYWCALQTCITPDGNVWECVNRAYDPVSLLGNLHRLSFSTIWRNSGPRKVDDGCRIYCRGHIANKMLNNIMSVPSEHGRFI